MRKEIYIITKNERYQRWKKMEMKNMNENSKYVEKNKISADEEYEKENVKKKKKLENLKRK